MLTYFDPFDNFLDEGYGYFSPRDQREVRRRREMEYRRRQEEEARLARRRRELAAEQEYLRQQELRERLQRRAYKEQLQKEAAARKASRRNGFYLSPRQRQVETEEEEPTTKTVPTPAYRVVQGLDGRLYRLPVRPEPVREEPQYTVMRGPGGRLYRVPVEEEEEEQEMEEHEPMSESNDVEEDAALPELEPVEKPRPPVTKPLLKVVNNTNDKTMASPADKPPKKRRSKVTVIVEDASDSEYEDDELNSVWRNRRPSPGQWMEPVENL